MDHIHTFLTTQGHGGPPRMSDQPNAETAQTINTKHTLSHPNKANMEWWLRWTNDIRGPWGPKVSWHLSYRWGKTPKKPHPGNLSRPGIEPGAAVWQAIMLPLAPQRWTHWYPYGFKCPEPKSVFRFCASHLVSLWFLKDKTKKHQNWQGS